MEITNEICPICNGEGRYMSDHPNSYGYMIRCTTCYGTGWIHPGNTFKFKRGKDLPENGKETVWIFERDGDPTLHMSYVKIIE